MNTTIKSIGLLWVGADYLSSTTNENQLCLQQEVAFGNVTKNAEVTVLFQQTPIICLTLACVVLQTVIWMCNRRKSCDKKEIIQKNIHPEECASVLSRLTFEWVSQLLYRGYKKSLENEDLPPLQNDVRSDVSTAYFYKYWDREVNKSKEVIIEKDGGKPNLSNPADDNILKQEKTTPPIQASLLTALICAYGLRSLLGVILQIVCIGLGFVNPMILKSLMQFIGDENEPMWKGIACAILLFLVTMADSVIGNVRIDIVCKVEHRMKASLTASIYDKVLRLSNAARNSSTVGEIVNLISTDTGRFSRIVHYINNFWLQPIQIILALYFIYLEVGSSVFAGFACMLMLFPINTYLAKKNRNLHVELSKTKDNRIKVVNEILNGMKVLKLYAWEPSFEQKIEAIRNKELKLLRSINLIDAFNHLVWSIGPFMVSLLTFATYVLSDPSHVFTAEKAFVSLALFNILSGNMSGFPHTITESIMAFVSLKRLHDFLNNEELDENAVTKDDNSEHAVSLEKATFTWKKHTDNTLKNISIGISEGSLIAVVGSVGSGKSSLLSAILGEMEKTNGLVTVKGTTAYVSQEAWIQNATLQDNILFGKPLNESLYRRVVEDCALQPDLDMLERGDQTEIGEKGINLSGGQKQRVNLARAVYQDADIYLLDDPLSAVDSHVGKHIFDKIIGPCGLLKNKTRLLVTHGTSFLPKMDKIVTLVNGEMSEVGTFEELKSHEGAFSEFLNNYMIHKNTDESLPTTEESLDELANEAYQKSETVTKKSDTSATADKSKEANAKSGKIIEEEVIQTGAVKFKVISGYIGAVGTNLCLIVAALLLLTNFMDIFSNVWLSEWSSDKINSSLKVTGNVSDSEATAKLGPHAAESSHVQWVAGYASFGIAKSIMEYVQALVIFLGGSAASKKLHATMLHKVMASPMSFFDTTLLGRIVARFSTNASSLDFMAYFFRGVLVCVLELAAIFVVIGYAMPWFLLSVIPIVAIYFAIQVFYLPTSRQLSRLETANKAPIYSHFSESIAGVSTIRAYNEQDRFRQKSLQILDDYNKCLYPIIACHRWLGIRMEFLGSCLVLCACIFAVLAKDTLTAGVVGLCITYTLETTGKLNWLMHIMNNNESQLVSIEKVNEYIEKPTEAAWEIEENKPQKDWPKCGRVIINDLAVRYRDGLDLVLKGISCEINPGEKVGIVGRTGAGKSSLTMALFRIIEHARGSVHIDGIDISTIGLHNLRRRLTIIPQDPVLFSGSLKMNLDPFDHYSEELIWEALEHAHLKSFVMSLPNGLNHECSEGGENLSVGQRQLICLARALLRKTKILILDEATAAVDMETDDLIQKTIRKEFSDCTILTIAHRLNTVLDYTRIMVLGAGVIQEFDTPQTLLKNPDSIFYKMAKDANLV